jgi:WD40 repeat protein
MLSRRRFLGGLIAGSVLGANGAGCSGVPSLMDKPCEDVFNVVYSPDGRWLVGASRVDPDDNGTVWVRETANQAKRRVLLRDEQVSGLAFLPDGKTLATGGMNEEIRLWDTEKWTQTQVFKGLGSHVSCLAFSPDAKTLAVGQGAVEAPLGLWDTATWKSREVLWGHKVAVSSISFSPNSKLVASGGPRGPVNVWDAATGDQLWSFKGHERPDTHVTSIGGVAFDSSNRLLATGGTDNYVRIWDVLAKKEVKALRHRCYTIMGVAFSLDGKLFASASDLGSDQPGEVILWDGTTWEQIARLDTLRTVPACVAFAPNGETIAVGTNRGSGVEFWDIRKVLKKG